MNESKEQQAIRLLTIKMTFMPTMHTNTNIDPYKWHKETREILVEYLGESSPFIESFERAYSGIYYGEYDQKIEVERVLDQVVQYILDHGIAIRQSDQDLGLPNLESNQSSINLEPITADIPPSAEVAKTSRKDIMRKVYKVTDHKTISGIILFILGTIVYVIAKWLGLLAYFNF